MQASKNETTSEAIMKLKMFAIFDSKAEAYIPPFFCPAVGQATRSFSDAVNSNSHQFGKHPYDFTLFLLGEFDDHTGIVDWVPPKSLGNGVEFRRTELDLIPEGKENVTAINANAPILGNKKSGNPA